MLSNKSIVAVMLPAMIAGAIALMINWRVHRDMEGVGAWPAGSAISILGAILRAFEDQLPDAAAILLADILIIGGQLIVLAGLCRFAKKPMFTRSSLAVMAGLIAGVSYFLWVRDNEISRTAVFTTALAITFALQAPALLSLGRQEGFSGVFVLAFVYIAGLPLLAWRIVMLVTQGKLPSLEFDLEGLTGPEQFNQLFIFVFATVIIILRAYGYILLSTNRVNLRLRQTATVDPLTGVSNRRAFDEELRRLAGRVRRDRICLGMAVLDIDHFKRINDTHGHNTGDVMLRHFAGVARSTLRDSDFFARIGGEEFVLVVADTTPAAFRQAVERIRHAFEQSGVVDARGELKATVSAGLAISAPGEWEPQRLYIWADEALYRAKGGGRNRIELAEQAPSTPVMEPAG